MKSKRQGPGPKTAGKLPARTTVEMAHLASFPELNPNPVVELDKGGRVKYLNPAALKRFPDLEELGTEHPFLAGWDALAARIASKKLPLLTRELKVGRYWYEQAVSYLPSLKRFRIYARDITRRIKVEEKLRQSRAELEKRVRERTGEISRTYEDLIRESTERRRAEEAVQAERQQFNDVLETLPCYLILLTPDYHVAYANRFFRERFGESGGRRCFEYLFHRTGPCEVCETYKVLQKMEPLEWEWVGPDGHNYYIYDFPFKDADGSTLIMETGIDITVQKQAMAALRQAQSELEERVQERTFELKEVNRQLRIKAAEHQEAETGEKKIAAEWRMTFDSISDLVSIQDRDCRLIRVNKAYAAAAGRTPEELAGQSCYAMLHHADHTLENCPHRETVLTRKPVTREMFEPRLGIYLEVTTSPIFDESGEVTGSVHIAKDVTARKKSEEELLHLNRELRAISACNQAIVRAEDEYMLYTDVCSIMCEVVGYRMAWVGAVEHDAASSVRPITSYGDDSGYLERANITWADTELGRGPTGVAARTGKTEFCQDFLTDPKAAPWREAALSRGYRSSIAMPLADPAGNVFAVFMLYSGQPDRFTPAEITLLEELAGDLAFGIGVLREKERRKEAEDAIQVERDRLISILNSMPDGIAIINCDYGLDYVNPAMRAEFGDIDGRKCHQYFYNLRNVCQPCNSSEIFNGATKKREIQVTRIGKTYEVTEAPLKNANGSISKLTIFHDITDRKKVEQIKDEFIGLVSHELRTPLTVINGSLRTALSEGLTTGEVRELIQNAIDGSDQLGAILENMLELSRYQAGHLKLRLEPVSIPGTVRSVVKNLKDRKVSQQFAIEIPAELPPVEADPVRVERIIYNLMENATKYTPEGSLVTVSARAEGDFIITAVADQGPGISPENQGRIFEQFQQLDTVGRPLRGAGLGLVVCKRLAEAQGGWIKVESEVGKGAVFSFALPESKASLLNPGV